MLSPQQLQTALDRFQLGKLIHAEPVQFGNFGQNVFLTTTQGAFVLRGAPLDAAQLPCERWFMQHLAAQTQAPVPWPYMLDRRSDIFGWSYSLMPRMPGLPLVDPQVQQRLSEQAHRSIARALGATLAELQSLTWPRVGNYNLATDTIQPLACGYADQVLVTLRRTLVACCHATARTTPADCAWVEEVIAHGSPALQAPFQACFVHGDYQESNVVVEETGAQWRVSGVFDMYPGFSDPETDLARPLAVYLDAHTPALAQEFLRAYRVDRPLRPGFEERFPLYMLQERLAMWEWAQREQKLWWDERLTLREWAEPFTTAWQLL
jgi:aminoglycoside phosphotransferase (APT) family kinase protein